MVLAVKISQRGTDLEHLFRVLPEKLSTTMDQAVFTYAGLVAGAMRKELLIDPLRPITSDRANAARFIQPKRRSRFRSDVVMPRSLFFLDTMRPHFVSLKRGRKVTRWAKKYYGSATITGRSTAIPGLKTVSRRGGKVSKGALWVTPHPFTNKALTKVRRRLEPELKKGVRKAFRNSRRTK